MARLTQLGLVWMYRLGGGNPDLTEAEVVSVVNDQRHWIFDQGVSHAVALYLTGLGERIYYLPMHHDPPALVAIDHDDYMAEHVGHLPDGRQFFLTTPFVSGDDGAEFVALYVFDRVGTLTDAMIDAFGPRASMDRAARTERYEGRLRELGPVTFDRIEVKPFAVERFGVTFGLICRPPEGDGGSWWVEVQPGNYMAFTEPWDSGEYDT
ncbi:hypothetical protein [Micromonospora psammae]|uniref:hypothetical protein n=1 Tax=Micromonospora sp. CPCC 205556 TaxID=3122398 RepID=UPI002FF20765